ncbi:MAG: hypothetical protein WB711_21085 [Terriglobales bacterium]
MIGLRLVRLIERHSAEIAKNLTQQIRTSPRTSSIRKIPEIEVQSWTQGLLQHLSEWLLNKTGSDIEACYRELGAARASQDVRLADVCWAMTFTKEHIWSFLQKQGFPRTPVELYGEMELLWLINQFFDRAICYIVEGYEQSTPSKVQTEEPSEPKYREVNLAAWVP